MMAEQQGCLTLGTTNMTMLPGKIPGARSFENSVRRNLDEAWELQFSIGNCRRPDADLLAVLPLQRQAGDQALAVFETMGDLVVLAIDLDAADGAFPVGLFQRFHQLG